MGKKQRNKVHGWVVFDKPYGMTSTQAVGKIRWLFNAEKAGHGGTLHPLAPGLLAHHVAEAPSTDAYALDGRKIYRITAAWGEERSTDFLEREVTLTSPNRPSQAAT